MEPSEFYEYEDRAYIQPTLSSGEQEAFIDNLRNIQSQNNAQIAQQTYNLGTQVPSNLGGLGGGEAYFTSRYQTPQMLEQVNTLKSAAQAQALNDIMSNYNSQLKQQYQSAYRNAQSRQRARQKAYYNSLMGGGTGGTGSNDSNTSGWDGEVVTVATGEGETSPIWQDFRIGDDSATYGLGMLRREAGEADDAWYKRANEWAEKQAMARNFMRTGKF